MMVVEVQGDDRTRLQHLISIAVQRREKGHSNTQHSDPRASAVVVAAARACLSLKTYAHYTQLNSIL